MMRPHALIALFVALAVATRVRGDGAGPPSYGPTESTSTQEPTTKPTTEPPTTQPPTTQPPTATTKEPEDYLVKYKGTRHTEYTLFACEGEVSKVSCPTNHFIYIYDVFWGRSSSRTCLNEDYDMEQRCESEDAIDIVRDECEGSNNCQFIASASKFGWMCNTPKYLRIVYQCYSPLYHALLCQEYGQMELSCPPGQYVDIIDGFWGRANMYTCPHNNIEDDDCHLANTKEMLELHCTGRTSCMMDATVEMFGNPCRGTVKYMEVDYICTECMNAHDNDADCEYWAAQGACTSSKDKEWMESNCRRTCWKCATPEQDAASCINDQGNSYCEYNAGRGECNTNPIWMHAYCKKACNKCDNLTPLRNLVEEETCDRYAEDTDQCKTNVYWMHQHCAKSCWFSEDTIVQCEDRNDQCEQWANSYECQRNPGYMIPFCTKSCTGCTKDPECVNEHDDLAACEYWASIGECERNAAYMYKKCWKSCMACGDPAPCVNEYGDDYQCEVWKSKGHCDSKEAWMTAYCKKSCLECNKTCINVRGDEYCEEWAVKGECELNPVFMHKNCLKSCQRCDDPMRCENKGGDDLCAYWADKGECSTNPDWMYYHCRLSCTRCGPLNHIHSCSDLNEKCAEWKEWGECWNNPSFMIPTCRRSCTMCDTEGKWIEIEDDFTKFHKIGHVGNPPTPGETNAITRSSTFLLPDAFPTYGRLLSVNGFFETRAPVHIQVWRYNSSSNVAGGWKTTYDEVMVGNHRNTAQTQTAIWPCVNIWTGDRLGFTTYGDVSPIAVTVDVMNVFKKTKFHDTGTDRGFIDLALPYVFSLGADFEIDGHC